MRSAIALSRTTSAEGHGSNPAATDAQHAPRRNAVVVVVIVLAVVLVMVGVAARPQALCQHRGAHGDDEQSRHKGEPRVETLRDDEAREPERDEAEREDARGVSHRHGRAEQHGIAGRPRVPIRYPATSALPWPG